MGLIYQKPGNDTLQLKELLPGKHTEGKLIIFSAPSGAGKTTIVHYLLSIFPEISFSISCTTRPKRENEVDGKDYYFLTEKEFEEKIKNNEFIEHEEVYKGRFYGTLHSEIKRLWNQGKHVIFDIDVKGGLNLKKQFKDRALAIFIAPPSLKDLEERLKNRNTENLESLLARIQKADQELSFAKDFDAVIINDNLEKAQKRARTLVKNFLYIKE
ncbi:MAG: guanylate kinase [Apibacter sp.]|jgi:guanylate kinase|uniref:Guanylate kinase n=1 Tax=Apibacter mensalis TaxID=1586267 RepID=A0A0X3AN45_9FLAO|nr:guanylate kinase [Apibacter mensalis]MCO6564070.1 guanylate kinase [Apibacter sp.]CVK15801.1 guanylate kinase [Apibacter mensalis]